MGKPVVVNVQLLKDMSLQEFTSLVAAAEVYIYNTFYKNVKIKSCNLE